MAGRAESLSLDLPSPSWHQPHSHSRLPEGRAGSGQEGCTDMSVVPRVGFAMKARCRRNLREGPSPEWAETRSVLPRRARVRACGARARGILRRAVGPGRGRTSRGAPKINRTDSCRRTCRSWMGHAASAVGRLARNGRRGSAGKSYAGPGNPRPRSSVQVTLLGPITPITARPRIGSSAGFHGAMVKVSSCRMTAILPDGVVIARS
jgi:hypothetical protein